MIRIAGSMLQDNGVEIVMSFDTRQQSVAAATENVFRPWCTSGIRTEKELTVGREKTFYVGKPVIESPRTG